LLRDFNGFAKIAPGFRVQVFPFAGFASNVLVYKSKEKILAKIHHPHFALFDLVIKRNHPVVFEKGDIEQSFQQCGFPHFAAGQDGGSLGFFLFDIVNPLEKKSQFFFSSHK
jgi:hypothetical protein